MADEQAQFAAAKDTLLRLLKKSETIRDNFNRNVLQSSMYRPSNLEQATKYIETIRNEIIWTKQRLSEM